MDMKARPVDILGQPSDLSAPPRIWRSNVATPWEDYRIVGVFNWTDTDEQIQLDLADLGLEAKPLRGDWHVFEFWSQRYLGTVSQLSHSGNLPLSLRAFDCGVLSLRKCLGRPQIIGASRHILQGKLEFDAVSWEPSASSSDPSFLHIGLSEAPRTNKPISYEVTLFVPDPFKAAECPGQSERVKPDQSDGRILRVMVDEAGSKQISIPFVQ
jgi:hypothetical protein